MDEKQYLQTLRKEVKKRRINKILVIPRDRIGDCISETPLLSILRRQVPHAHISILVTPYTKDIVKNNPYLDKVYIYHRTKRFKMGSLLPHVPFFYKRLFHTLIRELNREPIDLIISLLRPIRELRYIFKHVRHRFLINRDTIAQYLTDHGVTKQTPYYQRNLFFLQAIGIDARQARGQLFWSPEDEDCIDNLFVSFSLQDTDFIIAVHPGCATSKKERTLAEAKRVWPAENYPELLKRIMKNFNAKIILTGVQKEEAEVNRQIQAQVGDGVHVISRTTINQFAYLLSKCALMLTTDTGGLHVAAAVGTPIVALSGPTTAHQYSPFVPRGFFREVAADIGCRPCNLERSCNNNLCMQKISVDDVFHAISAHLKAHRKKGSPAER